MSAKSRRAPPTASRLCPVGHVGLQEEPHPGPARPYGQLPVPLQGVAERVPEPRGVRAGPQEGCGEPVRRVGGQQVGPDDLRSGPADDGQLLLEGRGEALRARGQEVGQGAPCGDHGEQQLGVRPGQTGEDRPPPRQVERGEAGLAEHPQTHHGLVQGREGEAGVREILDAQFEADDHEAPRYIPWRRPPGCRGLPRMTPEANPATVALGGEVG